MRVRQMDVNGDMTFGRGQANFLANSPAAVAQAVQTRFGLWTGEWFLDTTAGTPYFGQVLGTDTQALYDPAIQERALDTPGMAGLAAYSSNLDRASRVLTVSMVGVTQYGNTPQINIPLAFPG